MLAAVKKNIDGLFQLASEKYTLIKESFILYALMSVLVSLCSFYKERKFSNRIFIFYNYFV